jgi:flavodoxin I
LTGYTRLNPETDTFKYNLPVKNNMKAIVVYDSVFGNTEKVAHAISKSIDAKAVSVSRMTPELLSGIELLIVGSPTRAFRPTKNISRFLNRLPDLKKMKVAAFDTRASLKDANSKFLTFMVGIFGYAAETMAKKLKSKNGRLVACEGFFVKDSKGPMKDGEIKRAEKWARRLVR